MRVEIAMSSTSNSRLTSKPFAEIRFAFSIKSAGSTRTISNKIDNIKTSPGAPSRLKFDGGVMIAGLTTSARTSRVFIRRLRRYHDAIAITGRLLQLRHGDASDAIAASALANKLHLLEQYHRAGIGQSLSLASDNIIYTPRSISLFRESPLRSPAFELLRRRVSPSLTTIPRGACRRSRH